MYGRDTHRMLCLSIIRDVTNCSKHAPTSFVGHALGTCTAETGTTLAVAPPASLLLFLACLAYWPGSQPFSWRQWRTAARWRQVSVLCFVQSCPSVHVHVSLCVCASVLVWVRACASVRVCVCHTHTHTRTHTGQRHGAHAASAPPQ